MDSKFPWIASQPNSDHAGGIPSREQVSERLAATQKAIHEKFQPRNWKQLSERELRKLTRIERSRYFAVSEP